MASSSTEIKHNFDEIIGKLHKWELLDDVGDQLSITQVLEQLLTITTDSQLDTLAAFIYQELEGYQAQPPNYRYLSITYFDDGGQRIDGLQQYSSYPIITGVRKLEIHRKNGLTIMLPSQIIKFLSQVVGKTVDTGHLAPSEISKLLAAISTQVIQRLQSVATDGINVR